MLKSEKVIKRDWLTILESILTFKELVREGKEINYKEIPECLILAQKLSNQFDYFKKIHKVPNLVVSEEEYKARQKERDELYQRLYNIFDELKKEEIVKLIRNALNDHISKYKMYLDSLEKSTEKDIIDMLEIRDRIKLLYDELEIWEGKWKGGGTGEACSLTDKFCQKLLGYDNIYKKFVKAQKKDRFWFLVDEAKKRLIQEPDGTRRLNFWWWYVGK